jgi:DNA-directed RNA polymerase subunit M/transcription elongation factor TFIIS
MRFCPVCAYYLYLRYEGLGQGQGLTEGTDSGLQLLCRHCGYKEAMAPTTSAEALILETNFQASASQKQTVSQLNEFTKLDPTLPHLKTIACPNQSCPSQADVQLRDILYIKTDAKNLKYQYSCSTCGTQWGS